MNDIKESCKVLFIFIYIKYISIDWNWSVLDFINLILYIWNKFYSFKTKIFFSTFQIKTIISKNLYALGIYTEMEKWNKYFFHFSLTTVFLSFFSYQLNFWNIYTKILISQDEINFSANNNLA